MLKVWSFLISLTILFQSFNFDVEDFNRIPTLIKHLSIHLEKGDSYAAFFAMHYGSETTTHENEHEEHGQLPFKHQHADTHFQLVFVFFTPNYPLNRIEQPTKKNNFKYKEPFSTLVTNNFFQPPKTT